MSWNTQNKNASTFANQQFGSSLLTWDEAIFTWDEANGTWDNPYSWVTETKDLTTFVNEPKH